MGVRLLGVPMLRLASGSERPLERKVSSLLALVALESQMDRSTLAGLLWPDTQEASARNNLRQMLHRLSTLAGQPLLAGQQRLLFHPGVVVDVAQLEVAAFAGLDADVVAAHGILLAGHDYDDCPDLQDWILAQRERLLGVQRQVRLALTRASEAKGDLFGAIEHASRLLELDPLSEVVHRLLMTLHHQRGDRGAALRAYTQCQTVLAHELGVTPMPETVALAAQLSTDRPLAPASTPPLVLPEWVGRPPPLVGRSAAWTELESGWAAGQGLYITGLPGVGKTRLALDFLGSMGTVRLVSSRPEDTGLPYGSFARALRQLMADHPALPLPAWVRAEVARLLPELGRRTPPVLTAADKLRFYEAQAHLVALLAGKGEVQLLLDDLQFCDELSWEAWSYLLAHPAVAGRVRVAFTFRHGELPAQREAVIRRQLDTGQGRLVTLGPLTPGDVRALLSVLAPEAPAPLADDLARYTSGNPLFLIETLRVLHDSGVLARGWPDQLPHLPVLSVLLARRLEGLSGPALRVVRAAAVAGPEFTADLAARVLEVHPLDLAGAWAELTAAQVLVRQEGGATAFSHDLLARAALDSLPAPILAVLHARVAGVLQEAGVAEPARVAHHWADAGDTERAARWWIKAGWSCCARGADEAAAASFRRALDTDLSSSDALEARHGLGIALSSSAPALAEEAFILTVTTALHGGFTRQATESQGALAELYRKQGRLEAGRQLIASALSRVSPQLVAGDAAAEVASGLWQTRFWLELRSGQLPAAESAIREAIRLAPAQFWLENERAMLLWHTGRIEEAALALEALEGRLTPEEHAQPGALVGLENNLAWSYWMLGRATLAAALLERALATPSSPYDQGLHHSNLATVLTSQGHYRVALEHLAVAATLLAPFDLHLADVLHRRGMVQYRGNRFVQALEPLLSALILARHVADPYRLSYILASLAATQAQLGDLAAAQAHVAEAQVIAEQIRFPLTLAIAYQGASVVARLGGDHPGAASHALAAVEVARACGMAEQLGQSLLLTVGHPAPADPDTCTRQRPALEEALRLGQAHGLPDLTWRAALALHAASPAPSRVPSTVAQQAIALLRRESPPGWF